MIHFVSTFPPIVCGVGAYTEYLTRHLDDWRVTSFEIDESKKADINVPVGRVSYELSLGSCHIPSTDRRHLIWLQHAFGIWGKDGDYFTDFVGRIKQKGTRTAATFHTIHFESAETEFGLTMRELRLMGAVLPLLDVATVFSDGACRALSAAFPQFATKVVVLRHGTHTYAPIGRDNARRRLIGYLAERVESVAGIAGDLLSPATIILGNFGFVTPDKDPLALYEIGKQVRGKLPERRIVTLYAGTIANRADRKKSETLDLLGQLRLAHDGRNNLFLEEFLPEDLLPYAFRALDLCVFWCRNATQSGRIAHAMGARTCIVGRRIEGIGETLDKAGLLSVVSVDHLAEQIARLILDPASRQHAEKLGAEYAESYSFRNQAQKHRLLNDALQRGHTLPALDRTEPDIAFVLPHLGIASRNGLERLPDQDIALLNVADDVEFRPASRIYCKIPLRDGTAIPVEKMRQAVEWIASHIAKRRVIVSCRYGRGRSASVVIAYLCGAAGITYGDAVNLVAQRRADVVPLPQLAQTIDLLYRSAGAQSG
jgi:protein-tyrosine phosphatase/glycosyltransferase involved in cell wall biosynthesis